MKSQGIRLIDIKHELARSLEGYYEPGEIRSLVSLLLSFYTGHDQLTLSVNMDLMLDVNIVDKLKFAVQELRHYKPVQYITGESYFLGLTLKVNSSVMIPRRETEEMVDWIIRDHRDIDGMKILDIGTGSGCIAVALAKFLTNPLVAAVDDDMTTLAVARQNALSNQVNVDFIQADILQPLEFLSNQEFNIIVSNPPYVTTSEMEQMNRNVVDYEPPRAIFVPDNNPLLYYNAIADFAIDHLAEEGVLYLEINEALGQQTRNLLLDKGFQEAEIRKDLQGKDRMIRAEVLPLNKLGSQFS